MHLQLSHSALRRSGAIPRSDGSRQAKSRLARRQYSLLAKFSMSPAALPRFPIQFQLQIPDLARRLRGRREDNCTCSHFLDGCGERVTQWTVILTNSEINLSAVCSISERRKRSRSAYRSSRRRRLGWTSITSGPATWWVSTVLSESISCSGCLNTREPSPVLGVLVRFGDLIQRARVELAEARRG